MSGPFNAVTVESETITEITMSGPGAGGRQTASAVLGDVVSVMTGGARPPAPPLELALLEDVAYAFYLHLGGRRSPGRAGVGDAGAGRAGRVDQVGRQRGLGENARLVMVTHAIAESRVRAAIALLQESDFVRSTPRTIRVIEEEFI